MMPPDDVGPPNHEKDGADDAIGHRGPNPERLKIDRKWDQAVRDALKKGKRPAAPKAGARTEDRR